MEIKFITFKKKIKVINHCILNFHKPFLFGANNPKEPHGMINGHISDKFEFKIDYCSI